MATRKDNGVIEPKMVDMTKYGSLSFSTLQALNGNKDLEDMDEETRNIIASNRELLLNKDRFSMQDLEPRYIRSPYADTSTPFGESRFDPEYLTHDNLNRVQDIRANNQPWYDKVLAGVIKMPITVATTFGNAIGNMLWFCGDTVLNLVGMLDEDLGRTSIRDNIYDMAHNSAMTRTLKDGSKEPYSPTTGEYVTAAISAAVGEMWDNPIAHAMADISKYSEELFPQYRTEYEEEHPLNMLDHPANFAGDAIKMIGFTTGAAASGGVILSAMGLAGGGVASVIAGSLLSAMGEAAIEAVNNTDDWKTMRQGIVNDKFGNDTQQAQVNSEQLLNELNAAFEQGRENYGRQREKILRASPSELAAIQDELMGTGESALPENRRRGRISYSREQLLDLLDNTWNGYVNAYQDQINDIKNGNSAKLREIDNQRQQVMSQIDADAISMGNVLFGANMVILTISNALFFGRLFKGAMPTTLRGLFGLETVGLRNGRYYAHKPVMRAGSQFVRGFFSESWEEMSQYFAATSSGDYYAVDVDNFYNAMTDPDAVWKENSASEAMWQGFKENLHDEQWYTEGLMGGLNSIWGFPNVSKRVDSKTGKASWGLHWEGAPWARYTDYREEIAARERTAEYMNKRKDEWERKYGNMRKANVQNIFYEEIMRQAANVGTPSHSINEESSDYGEDTGQQRKPDEARNTGIPDIFNYKTAQHGSIVADVLAWSRAGRLDEYIKWVKAAYNTSDENLRNIVRMTTSINENGEAVGPFVDKYGNGYDQISDESKKDMIDTLKRARDKTLAEVDRMVRIRNWIQTRLPDKKKVSENDMDELVYLQSQLEDFQDRAEDVSKDLRPVLHALKERMDQKAENARGLIADENREITGIAALDKALNKALKDRATNAKNYYSVMSRFIDDMLKLDDKQLGKMLARKTENVYNDQFLKALVEEVKDTDFTGVSDTERAAVVSKLNDVLLLNIGEDAFRQKLEKYIKNPDEQVRTHRSIMDRLFNNAVRKNTKKLKKSLDGVHDVNKFADILSGESNENVRNAVLRDLEANNATKAMVKRYMDRETYKKKVVETIQGSDSFSGNEKDDAIKLFNSLVKETQTLEALQRAATMFSSGDDMFFEELGIDPIDAITDPEKYREALARVARAQYIVASILEDMNRKYRDGETISDPVKSPGQRPQPEQRPQPGQQPGQTQQPGQQPGQTQQPGQQPWQTQQPGQQTQGNAYTSSVDPAGKVDPVNENGAKPVNNPVADNAVGDITAGEVATENDENDKRTAEENRKAGKEYLKPAIPQMQEEAMRHKDYAEFPEKAGKGFALIYDYLKKHGAFEFINSGRLAEALRSGARIHFMIDPEFEDSKTNDRDYGGDKGEYTIFAVLKNSDGSVQVLGDLNEGTHAGQFFGLTALRELIGEKFIVYNMLHPEEKFVTGDEITTSINRIMNGHIMFSEDERSLSLIPNVRGADGNGKALFGIMRNGEIVVPNSQAGDKVSMIHGEKRKDGRLYLLVPNTKGGYSVAAVRVKHFNANEFAISRSDISVDNNGKIDWNKTHAIFQTPVGKQLLQAIVDFVNESRGQKDGNQTDGLEKAYKKLHEILFLRSIDGIYFEEDKNAILIRQGDGRIYIDLTKQEWNSETNSYEGEAHDRQFGDIVMDFMTALQTFNLPFQVSLDYLNDTKDGSSYNDSLIDSDILSSNLQSAEMVSGWFTMNPLLVDADGNITEHQAVNPENRNASADPVTPVNASHQTGDSIMGTKVEYNGHTYYVEELDGGEVIIRNERGEDTDPLSIAGDPATVYFLAKAYERFGDALEGENLVDGLWVINEQFILDITNKRLISGISNPWEFGIAYKTVMNGMNGASSVRRGIVNVGDRILVPDGKGGQTAGIVIRNYIDGAVAVKVGNSVRLVYERDAEYGKKAYVAEQAERQPAQDQASKPRTRDAGQELKGNAIFSHPTFRRFPNRGYADAIGNGVLGYMVSPNDSRLAIVVKAKNYDSTGNVIIISRTPSEDYTSASWRVYLAQGGENGKISETTEKSLDKIDAFVKANLDKLTIDALTAENYLQKLKSRFVYMDKDAGKILVTALSHLGIDAPWAVTDNANANPATMEQEAHENSSASKGTQAVVDAGTEATGRGPVILSPAAAARVDERNGNATKTIDQMDRSTAVQGTFELFGRDGSRTLYTGIMYPLTVVDGHPVYIARMSNAGGNSSVITIFADNGYAIVRANADDETLGRTVNQIRENIEENPDKVLDYAGRETALSGLNRDGQAGENAIPDAVPAQTPSEQALDPVTGTGNSGNNGCRKKAITKIRRASDGTGANKESSNVTEQAAKPLENMPSEGRDYGLSELERIFNHFLNADSDTGALADLAKRVFDLARTFGLKVRFVQKIPTRLGFRTLARYTNDNSITVELPFLSENRNDKSRVLLHETIHAVVNYLLSDQMASRLERSQNKELKEAVAEIKRVFALLKTTDIASEYGMKDVKEMVAELSNREFREKLKTVGVKKSLWQRIKDAIIRIFTRGMKRESNAYEVVSRFLDVALENFDRGLYNTYNRLADSGEGMEMSDIAQRDLRTDDEILNKVATVNEVKKEWSRLKTIQDLTDYLNDASGEYARNCREHEVVIHGENMRAQLAQLADTDQATLELIIDNHNMAVVNGISTVPIDKDAHRDAHGLLQAYMFSDEECQVLKKDTETAMTILVRNVCDKWDNMTKDASPGTRYIAMRDLYRFINKKDNMLKVPMEFAKRTFDETVDMLMDAKSVSSFNFYNEYGNTAVRQLFNDPAARVVEIDTGDGVVGRFVKIPSCSEVLEELDGTSGEDRLARSVAALQQISNKAWCTQSHGARHVLDTDDHAFWAFIPNGGKLTATMAIVPVRQGQQLQLRDNQWYTGIFDTRNDAQNGFDPAMNSAITQLIRKTDDKNIIRTLNFLGYAVMDNGQLTAIAAERDENIIDYFNSHDGLFTAADAGTLSRVTGLCFRSLSNFDENGNPTDDYLCLDEFDVGVYERIPAEIRTQFWEKIFDSLFSIAGDCYFNNVSGIKSLGNLRLITGKLLAEIDSGLESLGSLEHADEVVLGPSITDSRIEIDTKLFHLVDNDNTNEVILSNTFLDNRDSEINEIIIQSCRELASITVKSPLSVHSLYIDNAQNLKGIKGITRISDSILLKDTGVESLAEIDINGASLYISGKPVNLGYTTFLREINFKIDNDGEPGMSLQNIRKINGDAILRGNVSDIGNLEYIDGNLVLHGYRNVPDAALKSLGGLKYVGGRFESISNLEDLGMLETVGALSLMKGKQTTLGRLTRVSEYLEIGIPSFADFGELKSVGGKLYINSNATGFTNFGNLEFVGNGVDFSSNAINLSGQRKLIENIVTGGVSYLSNGQTVERHGEYGREQDRNDISEEYSDYATPLEESAAEYSEISESAREVLSGKGWTEERWNRAPLAVRNYAMNCAGF